MNSNNRPCNPGYVLPLRTTMWNLNKPWTIPSGNKLAWWLYAKYHRTRWALNSLRAKIARK